jgi:hypothetical protein
MDEIAKQIGCKPDMTTIFKQDPKLALHCLFVFFAFFGKMLELNGASDLPIPPIIALFAPFHLPGPTSLYCDGKQGPNRQCRASFGSCLKIVVMSGLHCNNSYIIIM